MNDRHKGSMHPVESSLHRLHWVLLRKTEGRVGDLVSLGAVGLEAERKWSWAETSGGSPTTGGGTESPRKPTSET